jgi:hypothetical protein
VLIAVAALAWFLFAALVAVAGTLIELRRVRQELRDERQTNDWQKQYLDRVGWRPGARRDEPTTPHGPRLWRQEPPRHG